MSNVRGFPRSISSASIDPLRTRAKRPVAQERLAAGQEDGILWLWARRWRK